jgi:hypothetical protein
MNRLIRYTASPARAKIKARTNTTARCDTFLPCLFDRAHLIAARAEMMENDAERGAARATRAATTKRRIAGARRKASLAVTAARWRKVAQVGMERPRRHGLAGKEPALPSW